MNTTVKVCLGGRGDEVVVLAGVELQCIRCWTERPETDCEVAKAVRLVALGQDPGVRRHDLACVKLLLVDVINDEFLRVLLIWSRPLIVKRTNNVDLERKM